VFHKPVYFGGKALIRVAVAAPENRIPQLKTGSELEDSLGVVKVESYASRSTGVVGIGYTRCGILPILLGDIKTRLNLTVELKPIFRKSEKSNCTNHDRKRQ
jgi:hypothetical protein